LAKRDEEVQVIAEYYCSCKNGCHTIICMLYMIVCMSYNCAHM